jgi:hypothetical protein
MFLRLVEMFLRLEETFLRLTEMFQRLSNTATSAEWLQSGLQNGFPVWDLSRPVAKNIIQFLECDVISPRLQKQNLEISYTFTHCYLYYVTGGYQLKYGVLLGMPHESLVDR